MVRTTTRVLGIAGWLLATAASGCGGGGGGGGGSAVPGPASPGGANTSPVTTPALVYPPPSTWPHLPAARGANTGNFTTSEACAKCHSNDPRASAMRDAQGRGVAPYDLWQGTMMANATRDPLWRAQVSVEIAATPSLRATIEKKCISCHAPMARAEAEDAGEVFDLAALDRGDARSQLGLDGVSCAACHQLEVDPQQIDASFDGNYTMGRRRELRGPHANPLGTPMSAAIGFLPVEDPEFTSSALCAGCHTLRTSAFDASGAPTGGSLPEQTPYLEWRNSVFNDELATPGPDARSCQGCHMPTTDEDGAPITTRIARDGGRDFPIPARSPYGRHVFVGGNTLIPAILRDQRADLQPLASDAAFDQVIALTRDNLRRHTADLTLGAVVRRGSTLEIPVTVRNRTGHKFPTGHPTRRAWVRLQVKDALGQVVFASGAVDAQGRLLDGAGAVLASERAGGPPQPHRARIRAPGEVQVYEALMQDGAGRLTFLLLRGEDYLKDNRLLPRGWSPIHADAPSTAPRGTGGDADFNNGASGADTVTYEVDPGAARGPFTIEAALLYQPLSARYADELFQYPTPEVAAFRAYYQAADRAPELVAEATAQVP